MKARIAVLGHRLSGVRSGAHLTHLELARALAERGHRVRYASLKGQKRTRFGDPVLVGRAAIAVTTAWADVVLVRDEPNVRSVIGNTRGKPVVYTVHSPAGDPRELGVTLPVNTTVVWVAGHLREYCEAKHGPLTVPGVVIEGCPIDPEAVRCERGDRVTLVNLGRRKGGELFWRLVEAMPGVKFLGVRCWGNQIVPDPIPENAAVLPPVNDPRIFYRQTRVVLLPSAEPGEIADDLLPAWGEAWNRVGVEAAVSGIPAIAHPAQGICASLKGYATYVYRDDFDGWVREIRRHMDPDYYREKSMLAMARAERLADEREAIMDQYEDLLASVLTREAT